jgi:hypothetical protein
MNSARERALQTARSFAPTDVEHFANWYAVTLAPGVFGNLSINFKTLMANTIVRSFSASLCSRIVAPSELEQTVCKSMPK